MKNQNTRRQTSGGRLRAEAFFKDFCRKNSLPARIIQSRTKTNSVFKIKKSIAEAMFNAGFNHFEIAHAMNKHESTVRHYLGWRGAREPI